MDKIRKSFPEYCDIELKNSCLFIELPNTITIDDVRFCIKALHVYISSEKLQFIETTQHDVYSSFIFLKNFNILDCCLVLSVIFAFRNKQLLVPFNKEYFNIPEDIPLGGSIYLSRSSILRWNRKLFPKIDKLNTAAFKFTESDFSTLSYFKEIFIEFPSNCSLTYFVNGITKHFLNIKFGKCGKQIESRFTRSLLGFEKHLNMSLYELPFIVNAVGLFDMESLRECNKTVLESSKANILKYNDEMEQYNDPSKVSKPSVKENIDKVGLVTQQKGSNQYIGKNATSRFGELSSGARGTTSGPENRPGFMTQEEIKEHCIATIKAAKDFVREKSPYQILKLYVKCPRQNYADQVYQQLNDLRAQTNCNIVVLNLSNLHESTQWFASLDAVSYTHLDVYKRQIATNQRSFATRRSAS